MNRRGFLTMLGLSPMMLASGVAPLSNDGSRIAAPLPNPFGTPHLGEALLASDSGISGEMCINALTTADVHVNRRGAHIVVDIVDRALRAGRLDAQPRA